MINKLWSIINYLHNFLMPSNQSLIMMEESKKLSEKEKENISKLMKKITMVAQKGVTIEIKLDD